MCLTTSSKPHGHLFFFFFQSNFTCLRVEQTVSMCPTRTVEGYNPKARTTTMKAAPRCEPGPASPACKAPTTCKCCVHTIHSNTQRIVQNVICPLSKTERAPGLLGQPDQRRGQRASSGARPHVQGENGEGQREAHRPRQLGRGQHHPLSVSMLFSPTCTHTNMSFSQW